MKGITDKVLQRYIHGELNLQGYIQRGKLTFCSQFFPNLDIPSMNFKVFVAILVSEVISIYSFSS